MSKVDEQYTIFAQEIEQDVLALCKERQSDSSISKNEFHKKYKDHIEKKLGLDIRAKIYEYISKHPTWKNRLDSLKFMDVLDECLRQYQPQGKFFLSMFLNRYQLRMQDTPIGDINAVSTEKYQSRMQNSYIDEKDSVFNNADSIDVVTRNDEESTNAISPLDKKSFKDSTEDDIAKDSNGICILYQEALIRLNANDAKYLRYFFTLNALASNLEKSETNFEYLDKEIFLEQSNLTQEYLREYQHAKSASAKNIQENAFLKAKYTAAIAEKLDIKPDTMRKKFKQIQNILTDIGSKLHLTQK